MQDKIFIDSNIFLYALSDADPEKQSIASSIVLGNGSIISSQVVNEVSSNLIKKLNFPESEVIEFINSCYNRYTVVELTLSLLLSASNLRSRYEFSFYDSVIVAAAVQSQASVLYSEDMQHGLIVDRQLTIVNPFK